jgi:hypothetical protein
MSNKVEIIESVLDSLTIDELKELRRDINEKIALKEEKRDE